MIPWLLAFVWKKLTLKLLQDCIITDLDCGHVVGIALVEVLHWAVVAEELALGGHGPAATALRAARPQVRRLDHLALRKK